MGKGTTQGESLLNSYAEGRRAFEAGVPESENPHPSGGIEAFSKNRLQWYKGYEEARIDFRVGHIFKKYNLSWP